MENKTKQKGTMEVWTSPISPALEESFEFQRQALWAIGILILIIISILFIIPNVSAMYAGNCEQVDVSNFENLDNITYTVVGNSSNLERLNITLNGTNLDICPVINYKPDSFTLIFWDNTPVEVTKEVIIYRGGGSRTIYKNITEYVPVETIKYIDKYIEKEYESYDLNETNENLDVPEEISKTKVFLKSIWEWIMGLFR